MATPAPRRGKLHVRQQLQHVTRKGEKLREIAEFYAAIEQGAALPREYEGSE